MFVEILEKLHPVLPGYLEGLRNTPASQLFLYTILAYFIFKLLQFIYRVTFHPLARFSGPLLARGSHLYQFYWEIIQSGQFTRHFTTLHQTHGPIVRTGPNRLHFSSPEVFHQIHHVGSPFAKDPINYRTIGNPDVMFGLVNVKAHKERRAIFAPMFSKAAINKVEPSVRKKVGVVRRRVEGIVGGGRGIVNMQRVWTAFAGDVTMEFTLFEDFKLLHSPTFTNPLVQALETVPKAGLLFRHFPILLWMTDVLPLGFVKYISQVATELKLWESHILKHIKSIRDDLAAGKVSPKSYNVVLSTVLPHFPEDLKLLAADCTSLFLAGIITGPYLLTFATYSIAANPTIQKRFYQELKEAFPDIEAEIDNSTCEKLPYLNAILKETLRLGYGVVAPLSRVVPPGGAELDGQFIPGDTVVEIDAYTIHHNEDLYPDSHTFNPDRWLGPLPPYFKDRTGSLEKYLVSFGGGSRTCIGMHLGWMELYLGVANFFRRFEVEVGDELKERGWEWADTWNADMVGAEKEMWVERRRE